jgi:hypothetical protein
VKSILRFKLGGTVKRAKGLVFECVAMLAVKVQIIIAFEVFDQVGGDVGAARRRPTRLVIENAEGMLHGYVDISGGLGLSDHVITPRLSDRFVGHFTGRCRLWSLYGLFLFGEG